MYGLAYSDVQSLKASTSVFCSSEERWQTTEQQRIELGARKQREAEKKALISLNYLS